MQINTQITNVDWVPIYDPAVHGPASTVCIRVRDDHETDTGAVLVRDDDGLNTADAPARIPAGEKEYFRVGVVSEGRDSLSKMYAKAETGTAARIDAFKSTKVFANN